MKGEIKIERKDPIAILTISRPEKLNSVTKEMLTDFEEKVSQTINDPEIFALVITGEGEKAFSAGFDLKMITSLESGEHKTFFKTLERTMRCLRDSRTCITVAAVNGYAVGFGAMVSVACDFRFFAETAAFRLPEVELGVFPGSGAASNLLHLVGPARSKDILLTTRVIAAEEALQIGLADRIFPQAELMNKTMEFLEEFSKKDRKILIRVKNLVDSMTGQTIDEADELEGTYTEEWLREFSSE